MKYDLKFPLYSKSVVLLVTVYYGLVLHENLGLVVDVLFQAKEGAKADF